MRTESTNVVSTHWVRNVPYITPKDGRITTNTSEEKAMTREDIWSEDRKHKYTVERFVEHYSQKAGRRYNVCWYRYGLEDDTIKPAKNITQRFIVRYQQKAKRKKKQTRPLYIETYGQEIKPL